MNLEFVKRINLPILIAVYALVAIGVVSIWSASAVADRPASDPPFEATFAQKASSVMRLVPAKQVLWTCISTALLCVLLAVPYMRLRHASYLFYALFLVMLVLLIVIGRGQRGVRRWIVLGPVFLQPSEFMKVALVLALASYMMYRDNISRFKGLIGPFLLTLAPMALVVVQPDLGTALLFMPVLVVMLLVAGAKIRHLLTAAALGLASFPFCYLFLLKDYQRSRITAFMDPDKAPLKEGYQLLQSKAAIGSGGLFGKGWGQSLQGYPNLVPERHTDFVFAVVGEEWGFFGSMVVIALYFVIAMFALRIALRHREPFGRLLIVGLITLMLTQAFVNIGMTVGLAPVTGITLPFMSYGGSSLLCWFISVGLILNIGTQQVTAFSSKEFESAGEMIPEVGLGEWIGANRDKRGPGKPELS
jgi:rod shape determining protein RodA